MTAAKALVHILIMVFLTVITQVGGIIWLLVHLGIKRLDIGRMGRFLIFIGIYVACSIIVVPLVTPIFGRVPLPTSLAIKPHTYFTKLCNRHYVTPATRDILLRASKDLNNAYPGIYLSYLDANFPFGNGFPLLPHLSHKDGKKVDLSFVYRHQGQLSNGKPSRSGYGAFVPAGPGEPQQAKTCKRQGYWQYDFTKYLTFGARSDLILDQEATTFLIQSLLSQKHSEKIFIEPHLKQRLHLNHDKIRYHGCQAVRHDDHLHFQSSN